MANPWGIPKSGSSASNPWGIPNKPKKPKKKKPQGGGGLFPGATKGDPYGAEEIRDLYTPPPFSTYDPALDAAAEAAIRGYQDIAQDFTTQKKIDKQDYRQTKTDIRQEQRRGTQDLRRDKRRGRLEFQQERQDIAKTKRRSDQDFSRRMGDLFIKYGIKGNVQMQQANAAGVADAGTLGAAAAARQFNAGREASVIQQAKTRQEQDIATTLQRLGIDQSQFMQDILRSKTRLGQDTERAKLLAGRDFRRARRAERRELTRAEREAIIAQQDYADQAAYQAHELHPGAVDKYGNATGKGATAEPEAEKPEKPKRGGGGKRKKGKGRRKKPGKWNLD